MMSLKPQGSVPLRRSGYVLLVLALLGIAGCAQKGSVSGKVRYNRQLLTSGTITFHNGGNAVGAPIAADGTYKIDKVPVGDVKVAVAVPKAPDMPAAARMMDPAKMRAPPDAAKPAADAAKTVQIPWQYQDPEKSGLTYTVTPGPQEKDFDLK